MARETRHFFAFVLADAGEKGRTGPGVSPKQRTGYALYSLDVSLPQVQDPGQAARLVAAAHQVCPYSNATRGNIDVTLTANGHEIG